MEREKVGIGEEGEEEERDRKMEDGGVNKRREGDEERRDEGVDCGRRIWRRGGKEKGTGWGIERCQRRGRD